MEETSQSTPAIDYWSRFFLIVAIIVLAAFRSQQTLLLEPSTYRNSTEAELYFFKDIDWIALDGFGASDLTLSEGDKTNGYTALTSSDKTVNAEAISQEQGYIDAIMASGYADNWQAGAADILAQSSTRGRDKTYGADAAKFVGMTSEELSAEKESLGALADGNARSISLGGLGMIETGYIYAGVSDQEKLVCEGVLPYITSDYLSGVKKASDEKETALKVVNNDHLYMAFSVPAETQVPGTDVVEENKATYMGENTDKQDYYDLLISRVDQLTYYPTMSFDYGDNTYEAYYVDRMEDGDNQIIVLLMKDYINVFADVVTLKTTVHLESYTCYNIPQSAIVNQDGQTYVRTLSKGYFEELVPVDVATYDGGRAILRVSSEKNQALSESITIKVYP